MSEDSNIVTIYKEELVRRAEDIIVNIVFCLTILIPIFLLYFFGNKAGKVGKLALVLGFVLLVAVVTPFMANAVHRNTFTVLAT
jgi:hypothetical protein